MTDTGVDTTGTDTTGQRDGRAKAGFFSRLYTGTGAFDVVGRRKLWYLLFGTLVLVCVGSIVFRGFNLGIDFTGGTQIQFPAAGAGAPATVEDVRGVYEQAIGQEPAAVQTVGQGDRGVGADPLRAAGRRSARHAQAGPVRPRSSRSAAAASPPWRRSASRDVSGTWGGQITRQALIALAVFLVLVTIFLAFYFERAMAVAALVALRARRRRHAGRLLDRRVRGHPGHGDRPADDPGLLALRHGRGVRQGQGEHPRAARAHPPHLRRGGQPRAEPDADALDQHLADRGAPGGRAAWSSASGCSASGTLADLALVQMVGIIAGAASSVLLATPMLVDLKHARPALPRAGARASPPAGPGRLRAVAGAAGGSAPRRPRPERRRRAGGRAAAGARHGRRGGRPLPDGAGPAPGREPRRPTGKARRPTGKRRR